MHDRALHVMGIAIARVFFPKLLLWQPYPSSNDDPLTHSCFFLFPLSSPPFSFLGKQPPSSTCRPRPSSLKLFSSLLLLSSPSSGRHPPSSSSIPSLLPTPSSHLPPPSSPLLRLPSSSSLLPPPLSSMFSVKKIVKYRNYSNIIENFRYQIGFLNIEMF